MAYVTIQASLEEASLWQRELAGTTTGTTNGVNKAFVVQYKPLSDNNYDDTITIADVVAYVDGAVVTVESVDATSGLVTLVSAPATSTTVTVDYSHSAIQLDYVSDLIAESEDWINTSLDQVATVPYTGTVPATIRKIARVYTAGLLMSRHFGMQATEEELASASNKIKLAERWLEAYKALLIENGEDVGGAGVPVSSDHGRVFQAYDEVESTWGPQADENFTVQEES